MVESEQLGHVWIPVLAVRGASGIVGGGEARGRAVEVATPLQFGGSSGRIEHVHVHGHAVKVGVLAMETVLREAKGGWP
jgi:hypothetical protein